MPTQRNIITSPWSVPGISKCKITKLKSAGVASPSTSLSQNVRSLQASFEHPSATNTSTLLRRDDMKDEDGQEIDRAAKFVKSDPRLLKHNYLELDTPSFEDGDDDSPSVSALQDTAKSWTNPNGTTGTDMQHRIGDRTDALHFNIGLDRIWLSNGISRPKYHTKQGSSVLKEREPQLLSFGQAEWLNACIDECTRRVDAMIAEATDALDAQPSQEGELVFELASEEIPTHDEADAAAALLRGWTSAQSHLIREIENLLE